MTAVDEALRAIKEFNRSFTSMNGIDVDARITVSRDEWRALQAKVIAALPVVPPSMYVYGAVTDTGMNLFFRKEARDSYLTKFPASLQPMPTRHILLDLVPTVDLPQMPPI